MSGKRRALSLILSIIMVLGVLPLSALAADAEPANAVLTIAPSTSNPTGSASIGIGGTLTLKIQNESTRSGYDFSVKSNSAAVSVGADSVTVGQGETGEVIITGMSDGTATISISNGNTSSERKATVTVTVGKGDPEAPDADVTVAITPSTDKPNENTAIAVGETLAIKITNGSSSSAYDFTVESDSGCVTVGKSSVNIAAGATETVLVTGKSDGTATITVSNGNSSYARVATVKVTVGEGGSDEPAVTGDIEVTPSTDHPSVNAKIAVEGTLDIKITNGSSSSAYDFTIGSDDDCVTVSKSSVNIAAGGSAVVTVTGVSDGAATITIQNETSYGSQYQRVATVKVTVGEGGSDEPVVTGDVEVTPSTDHPSVNAKIAVEGTLDIKIINGSSSSAYDFTIGSDDNCVSVSKSSVNIAAGGSAVVTVTGESAGNATITIQNENSYGSQYQRVATVNVTVGEGGSDDPADPPYSGSATYLAFTSDVHNQSGDASSTRMKNWLANVSEQLGGIVFDDMAFSGDLGPASGNDFWTNAEKVMKVVEDSPYVAGDGFYVCGNHEYSPGNYSHNLNETTKKYKDAGEYVIADDYILYSLGARASSENYSDADISDLAAFLKEYGESGKPIFVMAHFPMHSYSGSSWGWGGSTTTGGESTGIHDGNPAVGSAKIIALMNEYPNTFFVWGHNHSSSNDHYDAIYTDKINDTEINFTYCAAGAMSDSEYGSSGNVKGKGLVAVIEDGVVSLQYYDVNYKPLFSAPVEIEMEGGSSEPAVTYTVTAEAGENGSVTPASATVKAGRSATFTITPDKGYAIDTVTVNGEAVSVTGRTLTVKNVTADTKVIVTFKVAEEPVVGAEVDITPTTSKPSENAKIAVGEYLAINVTNSSTNSDYTFTVTSDDGCAVVQEGSLVVAMGATETVLIEGVSDGTATISITNGNSSYAREATVKLTVGEGGSDDPVVTGDVEVTPSTDHPSVNVKIAADETRSIKITNGSTSSAYDFTIESDDDCVTVSKSSVNIAAGDSAVVTFTGVSDGSATITIQNETSYGSQYQRVATVNVTVGEGGSDDPADPPYSGSATYLAFTSDVHNQSGDASVTRMGNWLKSVSGKLGNVVFDEMGFCGDMGPASGSESDYWSNAKKVMTAVEESDYVAGNGFYVCGNHEYNPGNYTHNLNETTKKYKDAGEYVIADDYILYSMGARQWDEIYSDADINALAAFLEEYGNSGKPVFILSHFPMHSYSGSSSGWSWGGSTTTGGESSSVHDGNPAVGSAKIISVLNEYPNVIYLWGHNHSSSNDHYDAIYTDKINDTEINFTYCAAGSMSDSEYSSSGNVKGKGLVAVIDNGTVTLQYYNISFEPVLKKAVEIEIEGGSSEPAVTYTVTAEAGENGKVSPASATVKEGKNVTLTITPDFGYETDTVTVNGESVSVTGSTLTLKNVTADMKVSVTFKKAAVTTYTKASEVGVTGAYILVSNGYALVNDNGTIGAVAVTVNGDEVAVKESDVRNLTWNVVDIGGTDEGDAGLYTIENGGYYVTRVTGGSDGGTDQPLMITTEKVVSEYSGLAYYQWTYDAENGKLTQVGGQDKSATFYVYYNSSSNAFYTASDDTGSIWLYQVKAPGESEHTHTPAEAVKENEVAATCIDAGSYDSVIYCSECGEEISREKVTVKALGHDLVHHDGKAATETESGWEAYDTCTRCDYTTFKAIDPIPHTHTPAEAVKENEIPATCLDEGSYDYVEYCSKCGKELARNKVTVKALGHDLVHHEGKAATATEPGWEPYDTCTRCDYTTYKEIPVTVIVPGVPQDLAAANKAGGVALTWTSAENAASYVILRDGKQIGTTAEGPYTDTTAKSGETYVYTVKAVSVNAESEASVPAVIKFLAKPANVKAVCGDEGITVSWDAVEGATGYTVYRRVSGTSKWTAIFTSTKATTLSKYDTGVEDGKTYFYTVRANSKGSSVNYYSSKATTGTKVVCTLAKAPAAPVIKSIANGFTSILVKWSKVTDADGYYVMRKSENGEWKRIAEVKQPENGSTVSFGNTTPKNGELYTYKIVAYKDFGGKQLVSADSAEKAYMRLTAPTLSVASTKSGKINLSWDDNTYATTFQIEYTTGSTYTGATRKTLLEYKTATAYTGLESGAEYQVRVRAFCKYYNYAEDKEMFYYGTWSNVNPDSDLTVTVK